MDPLSTFVLQPKAKQTSSKTISSYRRGDGELGLVSDCRDRVGPWLPQHPVPVLAPRGLAQEQPQQPGVGHHLHHPSAAAPSASPGAQVRASSVPSAGCRHASQMSAQGGGPADRDVPVVLYFTGMKSCEWHYFRGSCLGFSI